MFVRHFVRPSVRLVIVSKRLNWWRRVSQQRLQLSLELVVSGNEQPKTREWKMADWVSEPENAQNDVARKLPKSYMDVNIIECKLEIRAKPSVQPTRRRSVAPPSSEW